jgi:NADPH:quinone reductase-like Zn-dependent oxidoreductase
MNGPNDARRVVWARFLPLKPLPGFLLPFRPYRSSLPFVVAAAAVAVTVLCNGGAGGAGSVALLILVVGVVSKNS